MRARDHDGDVCHCAECDAPPELDASCQSCGQPCPSIGPDAGICASCVDAQAEAANEARRESE